MLKTRFTKLAASKKSIAASTAVNMFPDTPMFNHVYMGKGNMDVSCKLLRKINLLQVGHG